MAALMALMIWGFTIDAEEAPPLPLVVVLVAIPGVIILGVLLALIQRVQEIEKGEYLLPDAKPATGKTDGCTAPNFSRCGHFSNTGIRRLQTAAEVQAERLGFVIIFLNNREGDIDVNLPHRRLPRKTETGSDTRA